MKHAAENYRLRLIIACLVLSMATFGRSQEHVFSPVNTAAKQSPPERIGVITGHVVTDSGQPLEGATVYLQQAEGNFPGQTTTTDEQGEFRVDALHDALYTVVASARGYFMPFARAGQLRPNLYGLGDSAKITLVKGGVITGKVLDLRGEPVVGVTVQPTRTRDLDGTSLESTGQELTRSTDDQGIYRLYGLRPGLYVVSAGGGKPRGPGGDLYRYDAPTYFSSGTRDTANEIRIEAGTETAGIDIRYRGESGHSVSGKIIGFPGNIQMSVFLSVVSTDWSATVTSGTLLPTSDGFGFSFYGVPDSDYELVVRGEGLFATQHVVVSGRDLTDLRIVPEKLGSLAGRIQLESDNSLLENEACRARTTPRPSAVLLTANRIDSGQRGSTRNGLMVTPITSIASEAGKFVLSDLVAGTYEVKAQLWRDDLYVKSMILSTSASTKAAGASDASRGTLLVKPGQEGKELVVTLVNGAASVSGRIITKQGTALPSGLNLFLVPVQETELGDLLGYAETQCARDGSFMFENLRPGRYWLVVKKPLEGRAGSREGSGLNRDRGQLRKEAREANVNLELRPCQRLTGYLLPYPSKPPDVTRPAKN